MAVLAKIISCQVVRHSGVNSTHYVDLAFDKHGFKTTLENFNNIREPKPGVYFNQLKQMLESVAEHLGVTDSIERRNVGRSFIHLSELIVSNGSFTASECNEQIIHMIAFREYLEQNQIKARINTFITFLDNGASMSNIINQVLFNSGRAFHHSQKHLMKMTEALEFYDTRDLLQNLEYVVEPEDGRYASQIHKILSAVMVNLGVTGVPPQGSAVDKYDALMPTCLTDLERVKFDSILFRKGYEEPEVVDNLVGEMSNVLRGNGDVNYNDPADHALDEENKTELTASLLHESTRIDDFWKSERDNLLDLIVLRKGVIKPETFLPEAAGILEFFIRNYGVRTLLEVVKSFEMTSTAQSKSEASPTLVEFKIPTSAEIVVAIKADDDDLCTNIALEYCLTKLYASRIDSIVNRISPETYGPLLELVFDIIDTSINPKNAFLSRSSVPVRDRGTCRGRIFDRGSSLIR
jgi:hypothetical protein